MSDIVKTEAVVLSKLNYGESSSIVSLYTKERGKISVILKGGRSPKSKISLIVDPLNYLEVIIYNKPSRDIQVLTGADIKGHFHKIKEDLDKLKYAQAVIELVKNLTVEHEVNQKLFSGVVRILELMEGGGEHPGIQFGRFFLFFLKEAGYELQMNKCGSCGRTNLKGQELSYSFENGILCSECCKNYIEEYGINPELFNYITCLKKNENPGNISLHLMNDAISFMEKFLKYHVSDFRGLQTLQMFRIKL